ncbi:bifunctional tetrahydrofolate synthase/dihydrofolate synthase [Psychrobacter sp. 1U2]|uniref:bifunctional tetrahydrofolate synthase/dihydrofolate synthase n=1 Tax=Psychrobacter sp. 1U2 TaxID=3453577 RepID=UPI003F464FEE
MDSSSMTIQASTPTNDSSLTEWLDYMQQIHVSAIDMGLSRVLPVAERLGVVQSAKEDTYIFTVAGTNGKGSTTAMISELCQAAGYKTALYQSPHLIEFNERVRINGEMVSDETLIAAFHQVEVARLQCGLTLSFFEMTTLAALLIFSEADCEVWVLEVGLGGRLDVVNIIDPDLAVITNIGIDHVDWLGDNIETIGREKAGILREGIPLIYGATEMPDSIVKLIEQHNVTCYQVGQDFYYREVEANCEVNNNSEDKKNTNVKPTWQYSNAAVTLQLPRPKLSLTNTANAVSAVLASPLDIGIDAIKQALSSVKLAGRFDYRQIADRHWLFDVAHNEHGVDFMLAQLLALWQQHRQQANNKTATIKIVFSMLADKDIELVIKRLTQADLPISEWFIAEIDYPRAASVEQLVAAMSAHIPQDNIHTFESLPQAAKAIILDSQPQDLLLVCGSFHTIGETLSALAIELI